MKDLALSGLESAINRGIRLDPTFEEKLMPLQDKLIKIDITDIRFDFILTVQNSHVTLLSTTDKPIHTIICGSIPSFIKVGINQGSRASVFGSDMTISGDLMVGETISNLFKQLNIDWEYHLSTYTGDRLSRQIFYHGKRTKDALKRTFRSVGNNIKDYVFQEASLLPTPAEVEQHYDDIQRLKQDAERMEARIQRLQAEHTKESS